MSRWADWLEKELTRMAGEDSLRNGEATMPIQMEQSLACIAQVLGIPMDLTNVC